MGVGRRALSALGKIGTALSIVIVFFIGLLGTVYLSLRTSEVKVPDLLGKDRFAAETVLNDAGLNIRIKGTRPSTEKKPDTIVSQLPEGGMVVKSGQTVAVEISRAPREGESVPASTEETKKPEADKPQENSNANKGQAANQNQNQNQNQNKPRNTNKNTNKNANNSNNKNANNSNNANGNNRNANGRNVNANRNANNGNRSANTPPQNANRTNTNANKRPPLTTPPFNPGANRGTPR